MGATNSNAVPNDACSNRSVIQQCTGTTPALSSTAIVSSVAGSNFALWWPAESSIRLQPSTSSAMNSPMCRLKILVEAPRLRSSNHGGTQARDSNVMIIHGLWQLSVASTIDSETSVMPNENRPSFVRSVETIVIRYSKAVNGRRGALSSSMTK